MNQDDVERAARRGRAACGEWAVSHNTKINSVHLNLVRCRAQPSPLCIDAVPPLTTIRDQCNTVCTVLDRIKSNLAGDSNEWLPFYKLPAHLLVEIWDYLSIQDRLSITAVSRYFRSIALDSPSLWKYLAAGSGVPQRQFDTLLVRAGRSRLHIVVRDQMYQIPIHRLAPYAGFVAISSLLAVIPRATVLDTGVYKNLGNIGQQSQVSHNMLDIGSLTVPMPWLQSLRLVHTLSPSLPPVQQPTIPLLFGGYTPALRHLSITNGHFSWHDPIYNHLTYLLIRRPFSRCDFHQLVNILHSCPNLEFLGLDNVLGSDDVSQQGIALPLLERLLIAESDPYRVRALLDRLNAPNTMECDFIIPDWSLISKEPSESSPLRVIGAIREISIYSTFHHPYRCILECRADERRALRCQFDMNTRPQVFVVEQQARLYEALKSSYIPFDQVQKLTLSGVFSSQMVSQFFDLFPSIETLRARDLRFNPVPGHLIVNTFTDLLSVEHFSKLRDIEIGPSLAPSFAALRIWLIARTSPKSGCSKISNVLVASHQPLSKASRVKIASIVDKFKWKKATGSLTAQSMPPVLIPAPGIVTVPSQVNTTTTLEDGEDGWDEDVDMDAENEASTAVRNLYERYPSRTLLDDPMLQYCHPSLQTKWDYWALPGS